MIEDEQYSDLYVLASELGIQREWRDVNGRVNYVGDGAIKQICKALGYPASSTPEVTASLENVRHLKLKLPKLITTEVGMPTPIPPAMIGAFLTDAGGAKTSIQLEGFIPPIAKPGYYDLAVGDHRVTLAVSPRRFDKNLDLLGRRIWGPSIQVPALHGNRELPFGNLGDLADCVDHFAAKGADAVLISPLHALFSKSGKGFSPYSPSSRLFLNAFMADPELLGLGSIPAGDATPDLIDWESGLLGAEQQLRAVFEDAGVNEALLGEKLAGADPLIRKHALFEVLNEHFRAQNLVGWKAWPLEFQDPTSSSVQSFADEHARELEFHVFLQFVAKSGLELIQQRARERGMQIGIIADLAVGVHVQGSDTWMLRDQMLDGLTIGAPPDPFGPLGQNWMLTTFSPLGLRDSGFKGYIEMLRANLRGAGGIRIDHAFGLSRLWVIPQSARSTEGAYLSYPFEDLVRLACLEAYLADAIVVGEDLGTAPIDFSVAVADKALMGMRVMWFERAADNGFIGARDYERMSLATTSTHDTATVAGWWSGDDLELADSLNRFPPGVSRELEEPRRAWDRGLLWATFGLQEPRPEPEEIDRAVDASLSHIAGSNASLAILPFEDIIGLRVQTNVPGTIEEHPNWRRRYPATTGELLSREKVSARIESIISARRKAEEKD